MKTITVKQLIEAVQGLHPDTPVVWVERNQLGYMQLEDIGSVEVMMSSTRYSRAAISAHSRDGYVFVCLKKAAQPVYLEGPEPPAPAVEP